MEQLTGRGIAVDDKDNGQWIGSESMSFNQARAAIAKARAKGEG